MHEKSADRHHNPARLTTASNHLRGSLRPWRDFTMIGVCSVYPFGVVIWQDVSKNVLEKGTLASNPLRKYGFSRRNQP